MSDGLTLLTWPDYVDPASLAGFEQECGIRVQLEIVPSAAELMDRMRNASPPPDVLVPPDYAVRELATERRLAFLDGSRLPNVRHVDPRFARGRAHDPESQVSVIKDWGTTGIMFRTDKIGETPRSWADFWRVAQETSGHTTVLDSPAEVLGAALKMRGRSYNASGAEELNQARVDLLSLKPHLLAFTTDYRPLLASGEAWLALGWNGDAAALKAQGVPVRYVIPEEGSQVWEDDWAIAAGASNAEAAHLFLDFMLRPEIAAQEAAYTRYATGNRAALALLDKALREDASTYPPAYLIDKLEPGMPLPEERQRRRTAIWQEIRG